MGRADLARTGAYGGPAVFAPITARWRLSMPDGVYATPAIVGTTAYALAGDGTLYAADARTGAVKWRFSAGDWALSSPAVAHGLVYIGSRAGTLYALDARTGERRWAAQLLGEVYSSPPRRGRPALRRQRQRRRLRAGRAHGRAALGLPGRGQRLRTPQPCRRAAVRRQLRGPPLP